MVKKYEEVRFFLFTNSYSGNKIAVYLKAKYKGRKLTQATRNLSVVLRFKYNQVTSFVLYGIKPKSPYQRFPYLLKIYLEIEKELLSLSEEKLDKYSTAVEDYQRQLFNPAIERAVGNFLENIEDDNKFQKLLDEKFRSAGYTYYKVTNKYRLPKIRIVPFLLRLVRPSSFPLVDCAY